MSSSYTVGYIIGSLSTESINRTLSKALIRLAPENLTLVEIPIRDLPVYNRDFDADYPPAGRALKDAIASVDAVLFVTPEYNRGIPGSLKNASDWASRPYGTNSLTRKPSAVIGGVAAAPDDVGKPPGRTRDLVRRRFGARRSTQTSSRPEICPPTAEIGVNGRCGL
jgi:chromate reductase